MINLNTIPSKIIVLSMLFVVSISCSKNFNSDKKKYYQSEIFNALNLKIYGTWELIKITGGYTGNGKALDFETLELFEIGKFRFKIKSESISSGKIVIDQAEKNSPLVSFVFDTPPSKPFYSDIEKYIKLVNKDTLYLVSPCCDRYDYVLIRK